MIYLAAEKADLKTGRQVKRAFGQSVNGDRVQLEINARRVFERSRWIVFGHQTLDRQKTGEGQRKTHGLFLSVETGNLSQLYKPMQDSCVVQSALGPHIEFTYSRLSIDPPTGYVLIYGRGRAVCSGSG